MGDIYTQGTTLYFYLFYRHLGLRVLYLPQEEGLGDEHQGFFLAEGSLTRPSAPA